MGIEHWIVENGKYINPGYKGGGTVVITSNPYLIREFVEQLDDVTINYVKSFSQDFADSQYRGRCGLPSYLEVDEEFAKEIELQGFFKWIDKGWGNALADLTYNKEKLSKIKGG